MLIAKVSMLSLRQSYYVNIYSTGMQKYFWTVGALFSFSILQLAGENTGDKIELGSGFTRLHPLESLADKVSGF